MLGYIVECELPAREIVEAALTSRMEVHASGAVVCFANGGCPWKTHLYELERKHGLTEAAGSLVQFVLYPDSSGMWRVQAVTVEVSGSRLEDQEALSSEPSSASPS